MTEWFNTNEKSAGNKRLMLSWYLYKLLGINIALIIAFFVSLITFLTDRDLRKYSRKYFEIFYSYTKNKKYKPSFINSFKHIYSYAESLVYRMEAYAGTLNVEKVTFADETVKQKLFEQINKKEGIIFICNHIGNIDVIRTFLSNNTFVQPFNVSVFLQKDHCRIFGNFINKIAVKRENIKLYPIEDIDITTISQVDDDLKNGGIVLIAGDRISSNNPDKHIETTFLGKKIYLPQGTFKLAKILNVHTYFISCLKNKKYYDVYAEEQTNLNEENLFVSFIRFMEKMILIAPYQFYHFYDIFKE